MQLHYNDPDEGLLYVLRALKKNGVDEDSRNGPVRRFQEPVILVNENPTNRVSLSAVRNANPIFHFMESLWMLAGMNEVTPMAYYNSGIGQYSDDGLVLRGTAYGHKWRTHFGYDQLELAVKRLRANPQDRRVVMTMWDPRGEWKEEHSKDLSCNLQVIFGTRKVGEDTVLDMEVTNRSNDIVYGCLGSNVFHFSFLLEYMAYRCGFKIGKYYQVAFNLHGYLDNPVFRACYESAQVGASGRPGDWGNPADDVVRPRLLETGLKLQPGLLADFVRTGNPHDDQYLKDVGVPLVESYRIFKLGSAGLHVDKNKRLGFAQEIASQCKDFRLAAAAINWYGRKMDQPAPATYSDGVPVSQLAPIPQEPPFNPSDFNGDPS
jgi:hypothetical protein